MADKQGTTVRGGTKDKEDTDKLFEETMKKIEESHKKLNAKLKK